MMFHDIASTLAILFGLCWLGFVARLFYRQSRDVLPTATPTAEERADAATRLWNTVYPDFPDEEPDTAIFLLEESKKSYDGWVDSNARIEAKATWLTGFLAGGAGLLTVFGSARGDKVHIQPGPFLYLAIVAAFFALVGCLYVIRPKLRPHPSVSDYVSPVVAYSAKARFHIALSLAEDYNRAGLLIARLRRYDPVAWTGAQTALIVAVFAILLHFALNLGAASSTGSVVQCRGQSSPFHGGMAWKTSCKEHPGA